LTLTNQIFAEFSWLSVSLKLYPAFYLLLVLVDSAAFCTDSIRIFGKIDYFSAAFYGCFADLVIFDHKAHKHNLMISSSIHLPDISLLASPQYQHYQFKNLIANLPGLNRFFTYPAYYNST